MRNAASMKVLLVITNPKSYYDVMDVVKGVPFMRNWRICEHVFYVQNVTAQRLGRPVRTHDFSQLQLAAIRSSHTMDVSFNTMKDLKFVSGKLSCRQCLQGCRRPTA